MEEGQRSSLRRSIRGDLEGELVVMIGAVRRLFLGFSEMGL